MAVPATHAGTFLAHLEHSQRRVTTFSISSTALPPKPPVSILGGQPQAGPSLTSPTRDHHQRAEVIQQLARRDRPPPLHAVAFEAQAAAGTVECYARGCRPVYDDDEVCSTVSSYSDWGSLDTLPLATLQEEDVLGAPHMWDKRNHAPASSGRNSPCHIQRLLASLWADSDGAERYYESALQVEPRNSVLLAEYAHFAWNTLADAARAEELFDRALQEAPADSSILASYASFLWQTEA